ncbi:MAG: hypothetical protein A2X34_03990 [Elusimicrobia bacterium GWC2_51_8]|nr:MAG: hypothetical protein A2X33_02160 [Elusimicrobia bacterium GWA2_51_34]OGR60486.1 MAG: hypothetical protein A2X34_03990 [Elusimicrobia bacterium GWC2_51_8]OGR84961.1 MAG: hypothetical protein A2021_06630 [Elusimicrobia bacterium GWF2_52_66]HAF94646.1 hypothetical protein [Elusimicrobiota bacterium]HCE97939.1 hypothetical protein [Elusimicrobiota bacterium]
MKFINILPATFIISLLLINSHSAGAIGEQSSFDQLGEITQSIQVLPGGPLPAQAPVASPVKAGLDLTEKFWRISSAAHLALSDQEKAELRKFKILLVPGFLSNIVTKPVVVLGIKVTIGHYFTDQMKVFRELGIDYKLVEIESEAIPADNAAKIAREIDSSDKPVIIMGHSKGGLDTLETLIHRKDLISKVRGIITIQTPYFGSPIADSILKDPVLKQIAASLLQSMGGALDCLLSITAVQREKYCQEHLADINEIVAAVPVISFGSWKDKEYSKIDTILKPLRDVLLRMGFKNDGQVPIYSTLLPGAGYISIEGPDHFVTVMSTGPILKFDRDRFTKTLLLMLVRP